MFRLHHLCPSLLRAQRWTVKPRCQRPTVLCPLLTGRRTMLSEVAQSCPTLCDPIDGSPPGSPVPGILQARALECPSGCGAASPSQGRWDPDSLRPALSLGGQASAWEGSPAKITADSDCSHEIKRHLLLGRKVMINLLLLSRFSRV